MLSRAIEIDFNLDSYCLMFWGGWGIFVVGCMCAESVDRLTSMQTADISWILKIHINNGQNYGTIVCRTDEALYHSDAE